jgi:hypothetical protein
MAAAWGFYVRWTHLMAICKLDKLNSVVIEAERADIEYAKSNPAQRCTGGSPVAGATQTSEVPADPKL